MQAGSGCRPVAAAPPDPCECLAARSATHQPAVPLPPHPCRRVWLLQPHVRPHAVHGRRRRARRLKQPSCRIGSVASQPRADVCALGRSPGRDVGLPQPGRLPTVPPLEPDPAQPTHVPSPPSTHEPPLFCHPNGSHAIQPPFIRVAPNAPTQQRSHANHRHIQPQTLMKSTTRHHATRIANLLCPPPRLPLSRLSPRLLLFSLHRNPCPPCTACPRWQPVNCACRPFCECRCKPSIVTLTMLGGVLGDGCKRSGSGDMAGSAEGGGQ